MEVSWTSKHVPKQRVEWDPWDGIAVRCAGRVVLDNGGLYRLGGGVGKERVQCASRKEDGGSQVS